MHSFLRRPGYFVRELRRRHAVPVALVYIVVAAGVVEFTDTVVPHPGLGDWVVPLILLFAIVGASIVLIAGGRGTAPAARVPGRRPRGGEGRMSGPTPPRRPSARHMPVRAVLLLSIGLLSLPLSRADAQAYLRCGGSEAELDEAISAHEEQVFRINEKFNRDYVYRGELPPEYAPATLREVRQFLQALDRRATVLFYALSVDGRLCIWLISGDEPVVTTELRLSGAELRMLESRLRVALGVDTMRSNRAPARRGAERGIVVERGGETGSPEAELERASRTLLPPRIASALEERPPELLVVVPIGGVGTIPFAALPHGERMLVDLAPVLVAPGFFAFRDPPRLRPRGFASPIVLGDPAGWRDPEWDFPALAGARAEAEAVARSLGTAALVDTAASIANLRHALETRPGTGLIYLATHGVADAINPRDGSFLLMSDGRWKASEIQHLPLARSAPVVVLSACQTGLGKDFDVGTIGLARAWHRSGASSVVMSLWSVDDAATARLMTGFIELASDHPPEVALQRAMLRAREELAHPALWAGFTVFGVPSR